MRVTGKDEFEIAPGQTGTAREWVLQMERAYNRDGLQIKEYRGPASDHRFALDRSVGGLLDPLTGQIHLFYTEEQNLAFKAEEMAHYFQYKSQGSIGQTEEEIGAAQIELNEKEIVTVLTEHGFRRKRS
jgi:hypothetical protein